MPVYVALNSDPGWTAPAPSFKSVHRTLDGAKRALYPDHENFRDAFRESRPGVWTGPDGYGEIRMVEVKE